MGFSLSDRARAAVFTGALALGAFGSAAPAHAIGLDNPQAAPTNLQAGANSDFTVALDIVNPEHQLRNLTVELPPGLGGNPQAVEKCAIADFDGANAGNCPAGSVVGTTSAGVTVTVLGFVPVPLTVNGTVYNLVPNPGEPARLGVQLSPLPFDVPLLGTDLVLPPIRSQVRAELRPDDFGLNTILTDLPNTALVLGIPTDVDISALSLSLDESFMFNPTSCQQATTRFIATSWTNAPGEPATAEASFTPTGCESLPYAPQASLRVEGSALLDSGEKLPTVVTNVEQAAGEANTRKVVLTMPHGLGPNPPVAFGPTCSQADFTARTCPAATHVGSAVAETPLLSGPLSGDVYLLVPVGGSFPSVGIDLQGELNLQLQAQADLTFENGVTLVQSILDGLPDLPLSKFTLTFPGGQGALFAASTNICLPSAQLMGSFDSHAGGHVDLAVSPEVIGCTSSGPGSGSGGDGQRRPRCGGRVATIVGTPGRDRLRGTRRADVIVGLGGRDLIRGRGGRDVICGRKGNDRLFGGRGKDLLIGGKGRDRLFGGPGRDRLKGGRGRDLEHQ